MVKPSRDPESPTTAEWLVSFGALILAAGLVTGMVLFAERANHNTTLVNWFGLATALGGAVTFELLKYAVTVRDRHLNQLAVRINVTPARIEELRSLTSEVQRTRQMHAALSAAIELRARELLLARQREELKLRAIELKGELEYLSDQEDRLALDAEAKSSDELAQEVQEMIDALRSTGRNERFGLAKSSLDSMTVVMPAISPFVKQLTKYFDRQVERQIRRRQAKQVRAKASEAMEHRNDGPKGPNEHSEHDRRLGP